ncbi:MAG: hypothetical protein JWO77_217 [Ilumatobacteraceae bacterium]|nr:hypothetical protein [Ilumatobacteraceae bacterium]
MTTSALRPVAPGPGLPPGLELGRSNNNLDVARFAGRLWLALRTAPTHAASAEARALVLVSDDEGETWALDRTIAVGRDVREPRLVPWQGRLLLYWHTAGTRGTKFEPDLIWVSERSDDGTWDEPEAISPPDCVAWRVRPVDDRLCMTVYRGAGSLSTTHPVPLSVELWTSADGRAWAPLDTVHPVVHGGGAEAEFIQLPDGRVSAVVRKAGPGSGRGSDIAMAPHFDPTTWITRPDLRTFDSPFLFLRGGVPHLIARRQVGFGGQYDLGLGFLPGRLRSRVDQLVYRLTPKRTGLFRIDPDALTATWIEDLPSAGDTASASAVETADGEGHLVFNHSSPVHKRWWPWALGQLRPTHIYSVELRGEAGEAA